MTQAVFRVLKGDVPTIVTTVFTAGDNQWWRLLGFQFSNVEITIPTTTFRTFFISFGGIVLLTNAVVPSRNALDYGPEGQFLIQPGDSIDIVANDTGMSYFVHLEAIQ